MYGELKMKNFSKEKRLDKSDDLAAAERLLTVVNRGRSQTDTYPDKSQIHPEGSNGVFGRRSNSLSQGHNGKS